MGKGRPKSFQAGQISGTKGRRFFLERRQGPEEPAKFLPEGVMDFPEKR